MKLRETPCSYHDHDDHRLHVHRAPRLFWEAPLAAEAGKVADLLELGPWMPCPVDVFVAILPYADRRAELQTFSSLRGWSAWPV